MPDTKEISALTTAESTSASDLFETALPNAMTETGYISRKVTLGTIANFLLSTLQFSSLNTNAKKIIDAINELNVGVSSVSIGTTAPSDSQGDNNTLYIQYDGNDYSVVAMFVKIEDSWRPIELGGGGGSYVELTQAEYDALEQAGELDENTIYFINDVNGDGSQFQPVIFSTTEREIGVWTNGKPLYEKTIITNSSVTNADVDVDISNLNVDRIIYIGGEYSRKVNNLELYYPWGENEYNTGDEIVFGSYCRFYKTNDSITYKIIHKDDSTTDYQRFTIRYTKSTDTAGSGTWTPQGVPAVHYSTDERVVGTWIDGKPVYEKTQYISALPSSVGDWVNYPHGISNFDRLISVSAITYNSDDPRQLNIPHVYATGGTPIMTGQIAISVSKTNIGFIVGKDRSNWEAYVTIRYTKAST